MVESNTRGKMTFAKTSQPNSRSSQMFINLVPNTNLDALGFSPFGEVIEGMDVVDQLYSGYGEGAPNGAGPYQGQIQAEGNAYLIADFPNLDYVERASIED
jgi:peptidyl-prolyl cis-trans isomerase A (cyclophilin A)